MDMHQRVVIKKQATKNKKLWRAMIIPVLKKFLLRHVLYLSIDSNSKNYIVKVLPWLVSNLLSNNWLRVVWNVRINVLSVALNCLNTSRDRIHRLLNNGYDSWIPAGCSNNGSDCHFPKCLFDHHSQPVHIERAEMWKGRKKYRTFYHTQKKGNHRDKRRKMSCGI